jgi:hypothetical protein
MDDTGKIFDIYVASNLPKIFKSMRPHAGKRLAKIGGIAKVKIEKQLLTT